MRERPILFSAPMVRAILDGRKTQTRRVVKPQPWAVMPEKAGEEKWAYGFKFHEGSITSGDPFRMQCPYGEVGDRLWVRETWRKIMSGIYEGGFDYRADDPSASGEGFIPWKPSIHMPRAASRITLEITGVRVERLQDISDEDVKSEGVVPDVAADHFRGVFYAAWRHLWQSINGSESWAANPWVWVIEFKRVETSPA